MSTFHGIVDEVRGLSVDRFNRENKWSCVYFLTHFHTDHTEGLDKDFFDRLKQRGCYLYCSSLTKLFLERKHALEEDLTKTIKKLEMCSPTIIEYTRNGRTESLTVNTVPAGHCPGSVMFLFEQHGRCVLYTGDFRISPEDFPKLKPLNYNFNGKILPKKFDKIYMDTTFLNPDYPVFPSRRQSLEEICKVTKKWIAQDGNVVSLEYPALYGPEFLLIELSKALGTKIHVDSRVYPDYVKIDELATCVTENPRETRVHACRKKNQRFCRYDVRDENILSINVTAARWKNLGLEKISEWENSSTNFLYVCCSMHPSYNELLAFIDYFKPKEIYPCVEPPMLSDNLASEILDEIAKKEETKNRKHSNYDLSPLIGDKSKIKKLRSKYFSDDSSDES